MKFDNIYKGLTRTVRIDNICLRNVLNVFIYLNRNNAYFVIHMMMVVQSKDNFPKLFSQILLGLVEHC